ncbi:hypothetical protein OAN307_c31780 [Octadecabacter antarcticus 307]|uniref:Uncharacterized protein n=1 Tax=Octadecabacter antarcticus 307 TaxID=391626 RepID=M9R917_9RHOB|nr:hypothetical protein OAN307_c31780 [Octadecabacter antarcticus 307]
MPIACCTLSLNGFRDPTPISKAISNLIGKHKLIRIAHCKIEKRFKEIDRCNRQGQGLLSWLGATRSQSQVQRGRWSQSKNGQSPVW